MDAPASLTLTRTQKIRLAASVFVIYWPLRLYLNVDNWGWQTFRFAWLIWVLEIPLTILFLTGWLYVTEWLESRLSSESRRDFLIDVKWPAQLATLLIAGALAVLFNLGFRQVLIGVDAVLGHPRREMMARLPPGTPPPPKPTPGERTRRAKGNNGLTVMAMLMAFYLAANRRGYRELAQLRVNAEQLKREATQAQFVALRNQVNPHFLFNSLSILTSLVEVDPKLATRFINQLSKVYRYILEQRDSEQVSLKVELDFLESYCFLLNIRFEGKLLVLNDVPATTATRYGIAPLTLQLLVENAVKHNQMSAEQPLEVRIEVEGEYLLVQNRLQRRPQPEASTGLGLENIINRYQLLTDQPVWVGEAGDRFVVKLPLLS